MKKVLIVIIAVIAFSCQDEGVSPLMSIKNSEFIQLNTTYVLEKGWVTVDGNEISRYEYDLNEFFYFTNSETAYSWNTLEKRESEFSYKISTDTLFTGITHYFLHEYKDGFMSEQRLGKDDNYRIYFNCYLIEIQEYPPQLN